MNTATSSLSTLIDEIKADGKIDANEVARLREELYRDGKIDRTEAKALVELNEKCGSNVGTDPSWKELFAEAISDAMLKDESSPGVIDSEEAAWLTDAFGADGQIDANETHALKMIKERATSITGLDELFARAGIEA